MTRSLHPSVAWQARAPELARWAWDRLVNRADLWGAYGSTGAWTAPARAHRGHVCLTVAVLSRHFRGANRCDVVGLHTTSSTETSRWGAIDVDCHDDDAARAQRLAADAQRLVAAIERRGFSVLDEDSNGAGGRHLWILLDAPAPTRDVHALLVAVQDEVGTAHETFPKQPATGGAPGNWLRLPGRHHTRAHWSRVNDRGRWLAGPDAVRAVLEAPVSPAERVPAAPAPPRACERPVIAMTHHVGAGDALERRISAYVDALPRGLTAGEGRNRVAFNLALFLVVGCEVSDDRALAELAAWNRSNHPPIGERKLQETVANAHRYNGRYAGTLAARQFSAAARLARLPAVRAVVSGQFPWEAPR